MPALCHGISIIHNSSVFIRSCCGNSNHSWYCLICMVYCESAYIREWILTIGQPNSWSSCCFPLGLSKDRFGTRHIHFSVQQNEMSVLDRYLQRPAHIGLKTNS